MKNDRTIFLPGGDRQFIHLKTAINIAKSNVLIIGSNTDQLAKLFLAEGAASVSIIVDDHDSLIQLRYLLQNDKNISLKLMAYTKTDFEDLSFNLVFTQASISSKLRNKIIKEIRRILRPGGYLNVGEIVSLKDNTPVFVKDIWDTGNIDPLNTKDINGYYKNREFKIVSVKDLSDQLKEYYIISKNLLDMTSSLSNEEKSYHKKMLKRISHESNAYLKLGGNKFMGFTSVILRKVN